MSRTSRDIKQQQQQEQCPLASLSSRSCWVCSCCFVKRFMCLWERAAYKNKINLAPCSLLMMWFKWQKNPALRRRVSGACYPLLLKNVSVVCSVDWLLMMGWSRLFVPSNNGGLEINVRSLRLTLRIDMPPKVEVTPLGICELRSWGRKDHDFCRELTVVLRRVLILSCVRQFGEVYDTIHSVSGIG